MCIDIVEAQRAVEKYCDMYAAFQDTRECKLLKVITILFLIGYKLTMGDVVALWFTVGALDSK